MVAAAPSIALAAKAKGPKKVDTKPSNSNELSAAFVREGLMQPMRAWESTKPKPAAKAKKK
jgi:hypothetical protein